MINPEFEPTEASALRLSDDDLATIAVVGALCWRGFVSGWENTCKRKLLFSYISSHSGDLANCQFFKEKA